MSTDEVRKAAEEFCDAWAENNRWRAAAGRDDEIPFRIAGSEAKLTEPLLRTVLARSSVLDAENARMREERAGHVRQLRHAFAAGWSAARDAERSVRALLGSDDRERACRNYIATLDAELDAASQPAPSELGSARAARRSGPTCGYPPCTDPDHQPKFFGDECDCECRPGQPCLCPERDCYCGPCRVCGETPQQPARDTDPDEHRPFTMDDYREQLGGAGRRPRIGEEQR